MFVLRTTKERFGKTGSVLWYGLGPNVLNWEHSEHLDAIKIVFWGTERKASFNISVFLLFYFSLTLLFADDHIRRGWRQRSHARCPMTPTRPDAPTMISNNVMSFVKKVRILISVPLLAIPGLFMMLGVRRKWISLLCEMKKSKLRVGRTDNVYLQKICH